MSSASGQNSTHPRRDLNLRPMPEKRSALPIRLLGPGSKKPIQQTTYRNRKAALIRGLNYNYREANRTHFMAILEARLKAQALLADTDTYQQVAIDATPQLANRTLKSLKMQDKYMRMKPEGSNNPCSYGLPKVHKPDIPLSPIVSLPGTPSHKLAKDLQQRLKHLIDNAQRTQYTQDTGYIAKNLSGLTTRILRPLGIMVAQKPTAYNYKHSKTPCRTNVVYKIPCNDCNKHYIGQTGRKLAVRMHEHKLAAKQHDELSLISVHSDNEGH
eukprot:g36292.t1